MRSNCIESPSSACIGSLSGGGQHWKSLEKPVKILVDTTFSVKRDLFGISVGVIKTVLVDGRVSRR